MFHTVDAALLRAAAYPSDLALPDWPDLTADHPDRWVGWLTQVWALPEFADAVTQAAPHLADRITTALAGGQIATGRLRRLTEATMRYLLRWTTRATPFGRFAGIAPIDLGPHAKATWGSDHRDTTRPDDQYIADQVAAAERDPLTLRRARVVTNALGYRRGPVWVLPCARAQDDRVWDLEIDLTEPVRVVVEAARTPVGFADLTATTSQRLATDRRETEALLLALVREGVLVSQLRPPMTATDPASHLAAYVALPDPEGRTTVDRRIDCGLTLPPAVVREAQDAAAALTAVAPRLPGWDSYHSAFLDRWGPGAAVPLREVLAVLGFPRGYRGSRRTTPTFTAADSLLMNLAQQSALDDGAEIVLDDDLLEQLTVDGRQRPIPHTELRFTLAADTVRDLDQGAFTLTVVSGARHAGVAAARFLHLLNSAELDRFREAYRSLPTSMPGAHLVQLSGLPLDARLGTLARSPGLLPVLPVGDFHPDAACTVDDLAVAGDAHRLWLVSRTTGEPVEPLLLNAVLLPTAQQPLIRFLTEIWTAWNAPCTPLSWGQAHGLPFLPRVRRGRSILHPARWVVTSACLPGRGAAWGRWHDAWQRRRARTRIPQQVLMGTDDVRVQLDLDENAHLALLRSHLYRHPTAVLTEAPGPAGWFNDRPAEILLTLARALPEALPRTRPVRPATLLQHQPGTAQWLEARFHGPADPILEHFAQTGLPCSSER